jgi:hypothetical protein
MLPKQLKDSQRHQRQPKQIKFFSDEGMEKRIKETFKQQKFTNYTGQMTKSHQSQASWVLENIATSSYIKWLLWSPGCPIKDTDNRARNNGCHNYSKGCARTKLETWRLL